MLLLTALWLPACSSLDVLVPAGLPPQAPGVVLLNNLTEEGQVTVEGTVQGTLWVDLDTVEDDRDGFRYQVLDGQGTVLYSHSKPGPMIVKEFLAYYGASAGVELMDIWPQFGNFSTIVPLLDGARQVRFQVRDEDGQYQDAGDYDLDDVADDDVGLSEAAVGSETLWESGPSWNRLDIALVGDGYTQAEMGKWASDAATFAEYFLSVEPMASFAHTINLHRVDAVSAESGASYDCLPECEMRDTAFGTIFPMEALNRLAGTHYRTEPLFQMEQWEVARALTRVPWDMAAVVVNTEHYGGMAIHFATFPSGGQMWGPTGVHELAHILGLLGDEYTGDECIRSEALGLPVNITDDGESPPWLSWVEDGTPLPTPEEDTWEDAVGAFERAYNCSDLYRPAMHCRMHDSDLGEFCPVCAEALVKRIYRYADPEDDVEVEEAGDGRVATFQVTGLRGDARATWEVDGREKQAGPAEEPFTLHAGRFFAGEHTLTLKVQAQTDFVRDDLGDTTSTRTWTWGGGE